MSIKILAHRGASKYKEENTVESLEFAADMGADAVECDVTKLKDGTYVIFHDESLKRLTGKDIAIKDIGYAEMKKMLSACGRHLITFEELLEKYDRKVPILLHIKMTELEDDFVSMVRSANVPIVFGAVSTDVVKTLRTMFPPERILAFMPGKHDYIQFFKAGAGNIRLWEDWLVDVTPDDVKISCPGTEVWIMANNGKGDFSGSFESLDKCKKLGADAYLLDDILMALDWKSRSYSV